MTETFRSAMRKVALIGSGARGEVETAAAVVGQAIAVSQLSPDFVLDSHRRNGGKWPSGNPPIVNAVLDQKVADALAAEREVANAARLDAALAKRERKAAKRIAVKPKKPDTLAAQLRSGCPYCGQMLAIHESRFCPASSPRAVENLSEAGDSQTP